MRSTAALLPAKRAAGAIRAHHCERPKTRRTARSPASRVRRTASPPRRAHRVSSNGIAARTPLGRVRPLKAIPRGVVPYVKH
jgi:hypothetical protein